jgi:hypothetical protein
MTLPSWQGRATHSKRYLGRNIRTYGLAFTITEIEKGSETNTPQAEGRDGESTLCRISRSIEPYEERGGHDTTVHNLGV